MRKLVVYWVKNDESFPLDKINIIHTERILTDGKHGCKIPTLELWVIEEP
jgi:hypothetical protein